MPSRSSLRCGPQNFGLEYAFAPPLTASPTHPLQVKLMSLKDQLMAVEMEAVEVLDGLVQEFDRAYSELAEANKGQYNGYFTQVGAIRHPCPCCMPHAVLAGKRAQLTSPTLCGPIEWRCIRTTGCRSRCV